jgi:hypothetical protein
MAEIKQWPSGARRRSPLPLGAPGRAAKIIPFHHTDDPAMSDSDLPPFVDPLAPCPVEGEIRPGATVIEAVAQNGKPCRIIDNTGKVDPRELRDVLDMLVREKKFGIGALSAKGGNTIALNRPSTTHVQFGDELFRMLLFAYEARIEPF